MRFLCVLTVLAVVLGSVLANPVAEVVDTPVNEAQVSALLDVDSPQEGFENVGERAVRQFGFGGPYGGYGGYGGYRGGYGGYRGGYGGYRGGYGGYRGGYGGYRGGYGGYGGFYG